MTVRPVHLNGMIQNTQDVSAIRHQENQKPAIEQHKKDNADNEQKKFDAKEKGSNEYRDQRGKNKKEKKENLPDGSVKVKMTMSGGFDIKI